MRFEVYCDESRPELFFGSEKQAGQFLMIGSLWMPADLRAELKTEVKAIRAKQDAWGEIKWGKVSGKLAGLLQARDYLA